MILKTTTNEFCFISVSFYETIADPRYFFEQDYEEMPEYEEESDFDSYCNKFIPFVQEWANEVSERLYGYGVNNIKVTYKKVRNIYSKTFTQRRPTNCIIMSWINSDGRGVIRNINRKQNYARC